ncbi:hypothetical protein SKAU_G00048600 [Synaphobranchus kaupii]|uniref:Uncharacterized protein n=1 Tax=Synaphobranchus kaupii TaxID=118154 RepID=A0A9Q1J9I7_SYNKA|nr:hypothetical protein SKAU_G00048600 [Synaphobranchus kaupii]
MYGQRQRVVFLGRPVTRALAVRTQQTLSDFYKWVKKMMTVAFESANVCSYGRGRDLTEGASVTAIGATLWQTLVSVNTITRPMIRRRELGTLRLLWRLAALRSDGHRSAGTLDRSRSAVSELCPYKPEEHSRTLVSLMTIGKLSTASL